MSKSIERCFEFVLVFISLTAVTGCDQAGDLFSRPPVSPRRAIDFSISPEKSYNGVSNEPWRDRVDPTAAREVTVYLKEPAGRTLQGRLTRSNESVIELAIVADENQLYRDKLGSAHLQLIPWNNVAFVEETREKSTTISSADDQIAKPESPKNSETTHRAASLSVISPIEFQAEDLLRKSSVFTFGDGQFLAKIFLDRSATSPWAKTLGGPLDWSRCVFVAITDPEGKLTSIGFGGGHDVVNGHVVAKSELGERKVYQYSDRRFFIDLIDVCPARADIAHIQIAEALPVNRQKPRGELFVTDLKALPFAICVDSSQYLISLNLQERVPVPWLTIAVENPDGTREWKDVPSTNGQRFLHRFHDDALLIDVLDVELEDDRPTRAKVSVCRPVSIPSRQADEALAK